MLRKMEKIQIWHLLSGGVVWPEMTGAIFKKFLRRLETMRVCLVKNLKDPRSGESIDGLGLRGRPLCINASLSKKERLKTLIHELSHFQFPEADEEAILSVEQILLRKFSKEQRGVLESHIPKQSLQNIPARATLHR